jgi:hypothetical protein
MVQALQSKNDILLGMINMVASIALHLVSLRSPTQRPSTTAIHNLISTQHSDMTRKLCTSPESLESVHPMVRHKGNRYLKLPNWYSEKRLCS